MKRVMGIFRIFVFTLFFLLGVFFIFEYINFDQWALMNKFFTEFKNPAMVRAFLGWSGSVLIILTLLSFYGWFIQKRANFKVSLTGVLGSVDIRYSAISQYVSALVCEYKFVDSCAVDVEKRRGRLILSLAIDVFPEDNLIDVSNTLQRAVKDGLGSIFGIQDVQSVIVKIVSVKLNKIL